MSTSNLESLTKNIFENLAVLMKEFNTVNNTIDIYSNSFIGVVEDNNDPEKLGRCKVKVFGIYDNFEVGVMPWAEPESSNLIGDSFIVPELGTIVNIRFMNNDIYFPRYSTAVPINHMMKDNSKCKGLTADYPNCVVLFENDNQSIQLNRKTGQIIIKSVSGPIIHIGGKENGAEGGNNKCIEMIASADNSTYGFKLDKDGLIITDGIDGKAVMQLDKDGNAVISGSKSASILVGDKSGFMMTPTSINSSAGLATPDPANMGPFCALAVDPMTGLPHLGHAFAVTNAPTPPPTITADSIKTKAAKGTF